MSELATFTWIKRVSDDLWEISLILPANSCVVFRTADSARWKNDIGRRYLVIRSSKANRISQPLAAVFVCAFKSALIAEVA